MITIKRRDHVVEIEVDIGHLIDGKPTTVTFTHARAAELDAEFLKRHINRKFGDLVEETRSAEWRQGWKDAKSKRVKKRTWFRRFLGADAS